MKFCPVAQTHAANQGKPQFSYFLLQFSVAPGKRSGVLPAPQKLPRAGAVGKMKNEKPISFSL
jgi:hypothetical protein